jgi:hypothetical protein
MPRTVSCFEGERLASSAGLDFDCVFDPDREDVVRDREAGVFGFLLPEFLAGRVVVFDFCLLVAIRPSWCLTAASSAATDTSPAIERGIRRER